MRPGQPGHRPFGLVGGFVGRIDQHQTPALGRRQEGLQRLIAVAAMGLDLGVAGEFPL